MTIALPDLDFHEIRPYGRPSSRAGGFEELASILIEKGAIEWPAGTRLERFGAPDGGREGRGVLSNGDVWAWQAKYLFEFDASAARQATESVKRALDTEPDLRRYFVAMPFDLPAGDTGSRESAQTRWMGKVAEWKALAAASGREVEFEFRGRACPRDGLDGAAERWPSPLLVRCRSVDQRMGGPALGGGGGEGRASVLAAASH